MGLEYLSKSNKKKSTKKKFDEKYRRLTTYIEVDLYKKIQYMKETERIKSITEFYNQAIKSYINSNYQKANVVLKAD